MSFAEHSTLRRAVFVVALLNLAYFGVEFAVALAIGSVSLFADSVDFLEDASINLLIFIALSWSVPRRAVLGMVLAGILLIPGFATLWTAWDKFWLPLPPAPSRSRSRAPGAGGEPHLRGHPGTLSRPCRQSDPRGISVCPQRRFANIAIIAAGFVTAATLSGWPDLVSGSR
jgi:Co/Zn/Cd efflux system component